MNTFYAHLHEHLCEHLDEHLFQNKEWNATPRGAAVGSGALQSKVLSYTGWAGSGVRDCVRKGV